MSAGPYDKVPEEVQEQQKIDQQIAEESVENSKEYVSVSIDPADLDRLEVARRLGMEKLDTIKKHERRLDRLITWAKEKGAKDQLSVLAEISGLRRIAGRSASIYDLSLYAQMDSEKSAIQKNMDKIIPNYGS